MDKGTKIEKAGASTPATPSKVEGTQNGEKTQSPLKEAIIKLAEQVGIQDAEKIEAFSDAVVNLDKQTKDSEIETLKIEHQAFKDKLKPEIEKIQAENKDLKGKIEKLQDELVKAGGKAKTAKSEKKFIVISPFRDNQGDEGVFNIGDDVSHLDADRLENLVSRELVQKG